MSGFIGVSGTGRIGRLVLRQAFNNPELSKRIKAVNSVYPAETVAHLLKYDTVHGRWDAQVSVEDGQLVINGQKLQMAAERDPANIPWKQMGVDLVIDATGKFNDREGSGKHLLGGASSVLITAPGNNMDLTVVMGVNDHLYDPQKHTLLSAASCTTNCVSPLLKILDDAFQVQSGWMTTVHSYTSDQRHLDNPHKDLRRARACAESMIPTSTGVGKALKDVIPHLSTVIHGIAVRVPTPNVSLVDLTVRVANDVALDQVKAAFQQAAQGRFARYVEYNEEPLVSSDFNGSTKSAVVDALSLMVAGSEIKVLAWYDNEWGYTNRVLDLAELVVRSKY